MKPVFCFPVLLLFACCNDRPAPVRAQPAPAGQVIDAGGRTIAQRFHTPAGYERIRGKGYAAFLRQLPLHPDGYPVHYYDGRVKPNPGIYAAVLTYDAGTRDLQQCADAVMRLRADYLYRSGRREQIRFRLTNGFVLDYAHWRQGFRPRFRGHQAAWIAAAAPADDSASFRQYLDLVFAYAGTLSLSRELRPVPFGAMRPGDVLIVGGSPGHAVTVMDMATRRDGRKIYLLSQSYMPAQELQILQNPADPSLSPWYELDTGAAMVHTPQWDFTTHQLMRFPDEE